VPNAVSGDFNSVFKKNDLWESEDFVSLDPCSCPPTCPPKGASRLFNLPTWNNYQKKKEEEEEEKVKNHPNEGENEGQKKRSCRAMTVNRLGFTQEWLGSFLVAAFFAVLPAASILVLYVIPTSHKRLWAILGESVFLVCVLNLWNASTSEKLDILTYMVG
jgi:hypothetical protein